MAALTMMGSVQVGAGLFQLTDVLEQAGFGGVRRGGPVGVVPGVDDRAANVSRCLRMAPAGLAAAWCSVVLPSGSLRFGSAPRSSH